MEGAAACTVGSVQGGCAALCWRGGSRGDGRFQVGAKTEGTPAATRELTPRHLRPRGTDGPWYRRSQNAASPPPFTLGHNSSKSLNPLTPPRLPSALKDEGPPCPCSSSGPPLPHMQGTPLNSGAPCPIYKAPTPLTFQTPIYACEAPPHPARHPPLHTHNPIPPHLSGTPSSTTHTHVCTRTKHVHTPLARPPHKLPSHPCPHHHGILPLTSRESLKLASRSSAAMQRPSHSFACRLAARSCACSVWHSCSSCLLASWLFKLMSRAAKGE